MSDPNPKATCFRGADLALRPDPSGAHFWAVALGHTMLTYFEVPQQCCFDSHHHDGEQITLVLEGELFFNLSGEVQRIGPGEVIAVPAGIDHAVYTQDRKARAVDAWSPPFPVS